jgi:hypothetical protein
MSDIFREYGIKQYCINIINTDKYYIDYISKFINEYQLLSYKSNKISTLFIGLYDNYKQILNHKGFIYVLILEKDINHISFIKNILFKNNIKIIFTKKYNDFNKLKNMNINNIFLNINYFVELENLRLNYYFNNTIYININLNHNIYFSFSVVPPKFLSNDMYLLLDSLCNQIIPFKSIIINLCKIYKREFIYSEKDFENQIYDIKKKYSNVIINYSEDYGPITKICGLFI